MTRLVPVVVLVEEETVEELDRIAGELDLSEFKEKMERNGWLPSMLAGGALIDGNLGRPATLPEILKAMAQHHNEFPTHGINCVHMDEYLREIRNQVHSLTPEVGRYDISRYTSYIAHMMERI